MWITLSSDDRVTAFEVTNQNVLHRLGQLQTTCGSLLVLSGN